MTPDELRTLLPPIQVRPGSALDPLRTSRLDMAMRLYALGLIPGEDVLRAAQFEIAMVRLSWWRRCWLCVAAWWRRG